MLALALLAGLLLPLSFAPFHMPGFSIVGLAIFFTLLSNSSTLLSTFYKGLVFGIGFFGLGISWVYVSIHAYGNLNLFWASLITSLFVIYLAFYPALVGVIFTKSKKQSVLLFSTVWCLSEFLRANLFSGFPWLLLGFGQMDSYLNNLMPIVGIYGTSFFTCLAACCLANVFIIKNQKHKFFWLSAFLSILLFPVLLEKITWVKILPTTLKTSVIQENIDTKSKWDENLFWKLIEQYQNKLEGLIGATELIVLPEAAIPVSVDYLRSFLDAIDFSAKAHNTAILLGVPYPARNKDKFYNSMLALGNAEGIYLKQHLVAFGEYIPKPFKRIVNWFGIPDEDFMPGDSKQNAIRINNYDFASLICYELAYPEILRKQLPKAKWIVSISDDGWFGHSLAIYQHLQMAQALSRSSGRYQIVANNEGLSAIITNKGEIADYLPAFKTGVLTGMIKPATGSSPWVYLGDNIILWANLLLLVLSWVYPYRSN